MGNRLVLWVEREDGFIRGDLFTAFSMGSLEDSGAFQNLVHFYLNCCRLHLLYEALLSRVNELKNELVKKKSLEISIETQHLSDRRVTFHVLI